MNRLILVRGLPGSGKSTYAAEQARQYGYMHLEADMYFDVYFYGVFKASELQNAHKWCQRITKQNLYYNTVIVSNTFTQRWEMQPYFDMARELGAATEIITMTGNYGSIHNVPQATIQKMKDRWEEI
jgi:predicted kinase